MRNGERSNAWQRQFLTYHPVIGWWYIPNLKAMVVDADGFYLLRTNSTGMRSDKEYPLRRPPERRRIAVFGDSYTAGDGVKNADRFSDLLETLHPHLDVLNFGLNGSGTDQQLLIYESLAKPFEVDAYVFCVWLADNVRNLTDMLATQVGDKILYRPKPYFTVDNDNLVLHNQPVPANSISEEEVLKSVKSFTLDEPSVRRALTWALADLAGWRIIPQWLRESLSLRISLALRHPYGSYDSEHNPSWQLMRLIIQRFAVQVDEKPLFILPIPTIHHIMGRVASSYLDRFVPFHEPARLRFMVDVLPYFKRLPKEKLMKCFLADTHFSPLGHQVMAEAISDALVKNCPDLLT